MRLICAEKLMRDIIKIFHCKPFIEVGNTYEYVDKIIDNELTAFDIDIVLDQLEDYGKYKGILKCDGDNCENYIPVSMAKQIVRGKGLGGVLGYLKEDDRVIKDCSTCKNNVEYPPPHTCDICTSLDQEEEYEMWEEKDNNE